MIVKKAADAPPRRTHSNYPEPFASMMEGRLKQPLGDLFELSNFGVNLTTLAPGARSALQHVHSQQDEFIYVLEGEATIVSGASELTAGPGWCAGFKAAGEPHHIENRTSRAVTYLEVGDRTPGDRATYPDDDLVAIRDGGAWRFTHKDGIPYS